MTANPSIDPARFLSEHLERTEADLLRSMLITFLNALMGAEADSLCRAPYGARTEERVNSRNGYRHRECGDVPFKTGVAPTQGLAVAGDRSGSYLEGWSAQRGPHQFGTQFFIAIRRRSHDERPRTLSARQLLLRVRPPRTL